jgi:hypothetical protein
LKYGISSLLIAIGIFVPALCRAQTLVWEKQVDSTYTYDWYIQDFGTPTINYFYPINVGTRDRIEFVDIASGNPIVSIPRPVIPTGQSSIQYWLSRNWADADSGWEVLTIRADSAIFALYDGDKIIMQGQGTPQWMTDGKSTFLQVKSYQTATRYKYQVYQFRSNVPVFLGSAALGKSGPASVQAWMAIGPQGPQYFRAGVPYDSRGRVLLDPQHEPGRKSP